MTQNEKNTEKDIFREAEEGNLEGVEKFLAVGGSVNTADAWGNSPLHLAAWGGHEDLTRRLLDLGAHPDTTNIRGQTALHTACERGHSGVARMLVEGGADVQPDTDYLPPLHFAFFHCDSTLVDQLIERGADINCADADGATTLHRACWCDCATVVELLVDRGADTELKNRSGMTALDYAVVYGHSAVVDVFIDRFPEMIHLQDTKGWSRLHKACADNDTTLVVCLLDSGADVDLTTNYGSTPLHLALKRGSFEAAGILIDKGANLNIKDNKGNTPLHEAAARKDMDDEVQILVFQKLLDRGSRVDVKNVNNDTPFDLCRKDERFQVLVEHATKLRVAGIFVDLKNQVLDPEMKTKCSMELEKIKDIKICENTSLKVVFSTLQNPYYLRKKRLILSLDAFLQSPQALESLPLYNDILKNILQRSKCRLNLLNSVSHIFSNDEGNQWWNELPSLVQENVLLYLNNEDLEELEKMYKSK